MGAGGSFVGLGVVSLAGFFSFFVALAYLASLGGTVEEREALVEAAWLHSRALGMASVWELEGPAMQGARGKKAFSSLLSGEEASTPIWFSASFYTWRQ